jgi:hypothetical protein
MIDNRINPGDRVKIVGQDGWPVKTGAVLTSHNYGTLENPDWYIEMTDDRTGYVYWKQSIDGGKVERL